MQSIPLTNMQYKMAEERDYHFRIQFINLYEGNVDYLYLLSVHRFHNCME